MTVHEKHKPIDYSTAHNPRQYISPTKGWGSEKKKIEVGGQVRLQANNWAN